MIAGTLEIQLLANMARLASDMNAAKSSVSGAMDNIKSAVGSAQRVLGLFGVGLSAGYFVNLVKGSIDAADHLNDLSKSTNIAIEDLAGLKLLAAQNGTDLDGLAKGVNRMSSEMGKAPEKFRALGITATDQVGALKQLSDIFNQLPDINQRNALANTIFGKSWAELAPVLSAGGQSIGEIIDKGARLSGITTEMANQADALNDQWAELKLRAEGAGTAIANSLLPALIKLTTELQIGMKHGDGLIDTIVTLGTINPFRDGGENIKAYSEELEKLKKSKADYLARGWSTAAFDKDITDVTKKLGYLREIQREEALKGAADNQSAAETARLGLRSPIGSGDAAAAAAKFLAAAEVKSAQEAYDNLIKSIREKIAENNIEIKGGIQATDSDKLRIKILEELAGKFKGLNPLQRANIELQLQSLQATEQHIAQTKRNEEAAQADLDLQREIEAVQRERAVAAEKVALAVHQSVQAIEDETFALTHSAEAVREHNAVRELERMGLSQTSEQWDEYKKKILDATTAREAARLQGNIWTSIEKTAHDSFVNIHKGGTDVFKRLEETLQNGLMEVLYQMTVKKWVIQMETQMGGATGGDLLGSMLKMLGGGDAGGGAVNMGTATGADLAVAFADGGDHTGGLRLVGERGPELEATGPSRIFNAQQTRDILAGQGQGGAPITFAPVNNIHIDSRTDRADVAVNVQRALRQSNEQFADMLRQQGVLA